MIHCLIGNYVIDITLLPRRYPRRSNVWDSLVVVVVYFKLTYTEVPWTKRRRL